MIQKYYHAYTDNVDIYPSTIFGSIYLIVKWAIQGKERVRVDRVHFDTSDDSMPYNRNIYAVGNIPD